LGTGANFQQGLNEIQDDLLAMGGIAEKAASRAAEALKKRDLSLAHQVVADDVKINRQP
jgi:phosphate transport system protein